MNRVCLHILYLIIYICVLPLQVAAQQMENDTVFSHSAITAEVQARIEGKSWRNNPYVQISELSYLRLSYVDFNGISHVGELICNRAIASDLVEIFRELYKARYPIASLRLIDEYDADDERSMQANNTSSFCYRTIAGSRTLSKHARGLAIDINPLMNPCVFTNRKGRRVVQPSTAVPYVDRNRDFEGKIAEGDLCLRLFREHGFKWGGDWQTKKDYQHFEK
ncbi:MAG: M15 family metallopeptidase [Bacteroidaceae bacterium]|nr:M15 family metallopeptidase [Bacteroidaceae bacterium]